MLTIVGCNSTTILEDGHSKFGGIYLNRYRAHPIREYMGDALGNVFIDEVELHLHPTEQKTILRDLEREFPKNKFVVTTMSPIIIGETPAGSVMVVNGYGMYIPEQTIGLDYSEVLEEIMGVSSRNTKINQKLSTIFSLIDDGHYVMAKAHIDSLTKELNGTIPELVRATSLITCLEEDEC